jgi:GT2 family glycosyltransferase
MSGISQEKTNQDWVYRPNAGRLVIAIPTIGRGDVVVETIKGFVSQHRLPDLVVVSVTDPADANLDALGDLPFPVRMVIGDKGATRQRNRALEELQAEDILVFLDDDFLMAPDYLRRVERVFAVHPDIVMATGLVLADGIGGQGFSPAEGKRLLAELGNSTRIEELTETYNAYGCNMAMRVRPILENQLRFDEDLPLYSWLEDLDFSRQLAPFGRIVKAQELVGVHLGVKSGRTTGVKVGYSQISNPLYLVHKGTMKGWRAQWIMWRNIVANTAKSLRPEPWIDRRGRLKGNMLAAMDLLAGRLAPVRILDL